MDCTDFIALRKGGTGSFSQVVNVRADDDHFGSRLLAGSQAGQHVSTATDDGGNVYRGFQLDSRQVDSHHHLPGIQLEL